MASPNRNRLSSSFGPTVALLAISLSRAAVGAATAQATHAQDPGDMSLAELMTLRVDRVTGASKHEQNISEAPASITVLTAADIRVFGYRTLAEVLGSVRGLYVTYDRNYSNFGIRGFNRPGDFNTRVLLLVDGHRMNDNLYSSALIGVEGSLDVDLIERVEVIRGPSASLYGNSAFFGVINVVTRKGRAIGGAELSAEGGSFGTYKGRFSYGRRFEDAFEVALSGSLYGSSGQGRLYYPEFDDPRTNHGVSVDSDAERSRNLFTSASYRGVTLAASYSVRDKDVPTASFGTAFNDGRERTTDERTYVDLKYEHSFSTATQLMGRVYYDRYAYHATYPYDYGPSSGPPFIVLNYTDDHGQGLGGELQMTIRPAKRLTIVTGAEYRDDLDLFQSSFSGNPKSYSFLSKRHNRSLGLYAQGELTVTSNLLVSAGLRYDYHDNFGGKLSPRLALIYRPTEGTTVKLLYGQSFRAPNAYELYLDTPGYSKANPELSPETIRTYELVLEKALTPKVRFTASGYYYDIEDLISQRTDPTDGLLVFQNVDRITAAGLELELEGRFATGGLVRASYALQRAKDRETGAELSNSPRHLAKLGASLPLYGEDLRAGLELQYSSRLKTIADHHTRGFVVTNVTIVDPKLYGRFGLSLSVYNVFDQSYSFPGSTGHRQDAIPQDGRSFRAKLTYGF